MALFDFLLLLGKGTVMEHDGIWINMGQYVHDSKEASDLSVCGFLRALSSRQISWNI